MCILAKLEARERSPGERPQTASMATFGWVLWTCNCVCGNLWTGKWTCKMKLRLHLEELWMGKWTYKTVQSVEELYQFLRSSDMEAIRSKDGSWRCPMRELDHQLNGRWRTGTWPTGLLLLPHRGLSEKCGMNSETFSDVQRDGTSGSNAGHMHGQCHFCEKRCLYCSPHVYQTDRELHNWLRYWNRPWAPRCGACFVYNQCQTNHSFVLPSITIKLKQHLCTSDSLRDNVMIHMIV